jgi:hypothetical protein
MNLSMCNTNIDKKKETKGALWSLITTTSLHLRAKCVRIHYQATFDLFLRNFTSGGNVCVRVCGKEVPTLHSSKTLLRQLH